jgi:hypothetical protein
VYRVTTVDGTMNRQSRTRYPPGGHRERGRERTPVPAARAVGRPAARGHVGPLPLLWLEQLAHASGGTTLGGVDTVYTYRYTVTRLT